MAVTINDIARLANVDKGAVSRTLRNHPEAQRLRQETRDRILRIAQELGYQRNLLASSTRTGVVNTIAVIGRFTQKNNYFSPVMAGVLSESTHQNYSVKIYDDSDLPNVFSEINGNRIRYVISVSAEKQLRAETAELCRRYGLNLVYIYEHGHENFPAVNIDNFSAAAEVVRHLTENGHRRIGLLCVPHKTHLYHYIKERHDGFLFGLEQAGIEPISELMCCSEDLAGSVQKLLAMPKAERPTAVFGISDNLVIQAQCLALKAGLRLPEEFSTFGFGNCDAAELAFSPLSTVEESFLLRGEAAVKIVLGKECDIERKDSNTYLIPPTMIFRESVYKLNSKANVSGRGRRGTAASIGEM